MKHLAVKIIRSLELLIKTKKGKAVLIGGGIIFLLVVQFLLSQPSKKPNSKETISKIATKAAFHEFSTNIDPINSQVEKPSSQTIQEAKNNYIESIGTSPPPLPMVIYQEPPEKEESISDYYLPQGRFIKCVLVNTVDSSRIDTPIVGLVTEDVWEGNGICLIPAGTEVHGIAQINRSRDRISSEKDWTIVWQNRKELKVKGIALSNTQIGTQKKWSITDGSAGIEGEILKSDQLAQLKEILATTIAAAGSGLVPVTTTTSPFGNTQVATTGNAQAVLGASIQAAGKVYAEQIMQSIQRDGWFVRCPAGTKFYLYILEGVDVANARMGGSKKGAP